MTERVVADFVGTFYLSEMSRDDPVRGRIVMSRRRLVLAGESHRETVPTAAMVDVTVGQVPPDLRQFVDDSVTVVYERDGERRVAVVEADGDTVERFADVLFRTHLDGLEVMVEHPIRRGGRVVASPTRPATLALGDRRLSCTGPDVAFEVALETVTDLQRRPVDDGAGSALVVHHVPETTTLVSVVSLPSKRLANVLERFLRLEYGDVTRALADCSLAEAELEALVELYATDGDASTAGPDRAASVVDGLREKGLVVEREGELRLSRRGRIAVTQRLDALDV